MAEEKRPNKKEALEGKLEEYKKEYAKTKHNKATNLHLGILRAKIADVKKEIVEAGKRQKGEGFFVRKRGDATVALLGFPSAGKSSLINLLANTSSKTAAYAFTTTTIIPGTMIYKDAHIQIFDMPGIIEDAHKGVGGGKSVLAALKTSDLVVFVVDVGNVAQLDMIMRELEALHIKINRKAPRVDVIEVEKNTGIEIGFNRSDISDDDVRDILTELRFHNVFVRIGDKLSLDELIEMVMGRSSYMRGIVALNKIDTSSDYERIAAEMSKKWGMEVVSVSARDEVNIEKLKESVYRNLGIMTVYLSPDGKEKNPLILKKGADIGDAAARLHTKLMDVTRSAYVTGPSAKFDRQRVGVEHELKEGDRITFIRGDR
ncbi:MAG: 50S ribosome-binding GTPase [Candidatus Micrarchaeota archaeon]|nr:50S ribosome-binding GTPase [Candidatus Micrarchaeota archaeon]